MEKLETMLDRLEIYLSSEKFEKKFDKVCWWFIGLSFSYFTIRTIVSIVWDI